MSLGHVLQVPEDVLLKWRLPVEDGVSAQSDYRQPGPKW